MRYLLLFLIPLVLAQTVVIEHSSPYPEENALANIDTGTTFVYKIIPPQVEDPLHAITGVSSNGDSTKLRIKVDYGELVKIINREGNTYIVEIYLDLESGTYLVEERLPKGSEVNGFNVFNFDPSIFWIINTNGDIVAIKYRVKSNVPPIEVPQIVKLESCDVRVVFEDVTRNGRRVGGRLKILVNGQPAYVKDVYSNGTLLFEKEGMYYLFEGNIPFVVRGKVGVCPFEGKIDRERNLLPLLIGTFFIIAVAYILSRR